jgi:hypothetical protein
MLVCLPISSGCPVMPHTRYQVCLFCSRFLQTQLHFTFCLLCCACWPDVLYIGEPFVTSSSCTATNHDVVICCLCCAAPDVPYIGEPFVTSSYTATNYLLLSAVLRLMCHTSVSPLSPHHILRQIIFCCLLCCA